MKAVIQEFEFDVYHITGVDSEIIDAFSRKFPIVNPSNEDLLFVE